MQHFADTLTLDTKRRTRDGYLACRAKAGRVGIYDYLGSEIDPEGTKFAADQIVKVYRSTDEVFAKDSVASFLMKPVTNDHPAQPVTADNWKHYAKGIVGKAMRDGDFLAFDLVLMDAAIIADVESGKRELSNGYASEIHFEDGVAPGGQSYQAVQRMIRGNHVAVVDKGRAGDNCRITDCADCACIPSADAAQIIRDGETYSAEDLRDKNSRDEISNPGAILMATKLIQFDGMPIEATDQAEAAIRKLEGQVQSLSDAKAAAETKAGELAASVATKDGEIAGLNQKLKDAEVGPEKLQQMVADRAALIEKAKAIDPKVVTDGKTDAEIRQAVVAAKLGDATPADENGIAGAFAALTKDAKPAGKDPVRQVIADGAVQIGDTASIRDAARTSRYAPAN